MVVEFAAFQLSACAVMMSDERGRGFWCFCNKEMILRAPSILLHAMSERAGTISTVNCKHS